MQVQEKRIRTGSFTTFYREAGSGPPLILIHGGGPGADSYGNWKDTMPTFARHFHVYAYDMVGFGNSEAPDPANFTYSMDARAQQLYDFVVGVGQARGDARVIGNSMGGAAALGLAMAHPEVVHRMVLMGSAGVPMQLSPEVGKLMHYDFTMEGMRAIATALAYPGFKLADEMVKYRYDLTMKEDIRRGTAATQAWVKANGGPNYSEERIAAVKTKSLVFHGKQDKVVPLKIAYRMLELLENSDGYILPHCGHWAMLEQPEIFARVCVEYLR